MSLFLATFKRIHTNFVRMKRHNKLSSTESTAQDPSAKKRHWSEGLLETMQNPEFIVKEDNKIVIIKDKYPKAQHHYLVLPKENIQSVMQLRKEHESLLEHMEKVGQELANEQEGHEFLLGYHAVPSMQRVHLHVISTDFNSPCLKTKLHWNSFTTPFFLPSLAVREELKKHGQFKPMPKIKSDTYLKTELQCHRCSVKPKNMPELKRHLLTHLPQK